MRAVTGMVRRTGDQQGLADETGDAVATLDNELERAPQGSDKVTPALRLRLSIQKKFDIFLRTSFSASCSSASAEGADTGLNCPAPSS